MKLHRSLALLVALLLTACGPLKVDVVPTPTPIPRPLPVCRSSGQYYHFCQMDLVSPDQQHRWPQECEDHGMDLDCQILFPNGQKSTVYYFPLEWSSTNIYALVPMGGNHDSLSGGYELWNMLTATRTAMFDPAGYPWIRMSKWLEWAPDGLSVFYLKDGSPDRTSIVLAQIDAATGAESVTRQCPNWLLATLRSADDYRHWGPYCDNVQMPLDVPALLSFTVEPTAIKAGESVTFRWTSQGGTTATLHYYMTDAPSEIRVPVSGTLSMRVAPSMGSEAYTVIVFDLRLTNDSGQADVSTVGLPVNQ